VTLRDIDREAPGSAAVRQPSAVGAGIWRISVPIMAIPTVETLVFAIEAGPKLILIDAGWNDEVAWQALQDSFTQLGLDLAAVEGVLVTHHHPDHSGLAGRIQQRSDCWIAMHEADCDLLKEVASVGDKHSDWEAENLRVAGAGPGDIEAFLSHGSIVESTRPTPADRRLTDGQVIACGEQAITVVGTPGHTPGHMCLALRERRVLFSGDHVLSRTTPHIGLYDYPLATKDPLGQYLSSLKRTRTFHGWTIWPAHEEPIQDLTARLGEIERHHLDRLDEVLSVLTEEPLSLWNVAAALKWQGHWEQLPPLSRQLALAEAAAHIQHLLSSGQVDRLAGHPERFTPTRAHASLRRSTGPDQPTNITHLTTSEVSHGCT
jgi:glyoxylase-like metal-dependent hydrolase (beta-lactamase superfamily II)